MRFDLIKPVNGWRAFWGEVGIIVLGVLIALGAQQVAERVRDRQLASLGSNWQVLKARRCSIIRIKYVCRA